MKCLFVRQAKCSELMCAYFFIITLLGTDYIVWFFSARDLTPRSNANLGVCLKSQAKILYYISFVLLPFASHF